MEEDSDMAFNLQVEEALTASLLDGGSISSPTTDTILGADISKALKDDHLDDYEQFLLDHYKAEAEMKRLQSDLSLQIHDRAFACEILNVPDEEWYKTGDDVSRPYGEGSSSGGDLVFSIYVKGLVEGKAGAIGVGICDENDGLMFEMSKGFSGKECQASEELVESKALIEGLDTATTLGLKRLNIVTNCSLLYQHITGKNPLMSANVVKLSEQIHLLLRKFTQTRVYLKTPENIKYAFELARNAIAQELNRSAGSSSTANAIESCPICFEDAYEDQMFQITGCLHSYCVSCLMKHAQYKLLLGVLPKCPHENCKSELNIDTCKKFLTPELFSIMRQRMKEVSIPVEEKVYCPYPRCSALCSKSELVGSSINHTNLTALFLGERTCPKCSGVFCINCKAPWHTGMTCSDFQQRNPHLGNEEKKLKSLATQNLWRQCPKCNHMISLAAGCYHIYCRCGHEFCYTCGAEWNNKKATCTCPIWDERNLEYDD